ncbi:MAG: hypothetical protein ACRENE_17825 [Polyangiaceae bacterium]
MKRTLSAVAASVAVVILTGAPAAMAQAAKSDFGAQGEFIISADRLLPILAWSKDTISDNNHNSVSSEQTSLSLLAGTTNNPVIGEVGNVAAIQGGRLLLGNAVLQSVYNVPRVGFDYTIVPNVTIGGDLMLWFVLGSDVTVSNANMSTTTSGPGGTAFGIAPRGGYILGLNDTFSLWLRGGLSFYTASFSQSSGLMGCNSAPNNGGNMNLFGLDLDPQFVISPMNHVAITVGPAVDLGFAGGASATVYNGCNNSTTTSYGYQQYNVALNAGALVYF